MNRTIIFISFFLITFNLFNQNIPSYEPLMEEFFLIYKKNTPPEAIDFIFKTNPIIIQKNAEEITQIKLRLSAITAMLGEYHGYEKIREQKYGESLVVVTYMLKYSYQPLFYTFTLYYPNNKWQLQTIKFDDKISDLR
ncbi:MAG: hypothetical protein WBL11_06340 [Bacteroidales bacterium]|mgnify:CR=1 FL=1|jgi:hypothetical protein|nr:hypothetical protein [Bacteroidales bacterium]MDI9575333.1 hypothetical protein [Bacteroidota bacterium]MDD3755045.1 hypothetical protein [Bacteroidales bacterium]MDY0401190.1 hypothetical protein [Bacteroidales bacterium]HHW60262.1 hypothetical protein [Bacteroidales bacterium]